jgi:hypothetical protein
MTAITFSLANLTAPEDRAPLVRQCAGHMPPQGMRVYLSRHGEVSAGYRADTDSASPSPDETHQVTLSWGVSPHANGTVLATLLHGPARALLEAIHAGHTVEWDGASLRGTLTPEADAASFELSELLEETFEGDPSNGASLAQEGGAA